MNEATPGQAAPVALGDVSNYQMTDFVADKYGKRIEVGRTDSETVVIPPPGIGALFFDADQRERFQAAIAAQQPAPEVRTCYCGTTATVVPGVFPHPDCDGSAVPQAAAGRGHVGTIENTETGTTWVSWDRRMTPAWPEIASAVSRLSGGIVLIREGVDVDESEEPDRAYVVVERDLATPQPAPELASDDVHVDWHMTSEEWRQLAAVLALRPDLPYVRALINAGKVPAFAPEPASTVQPAPDLAAAGRPTTSLEDAMLRNVDGLNGLVRDMLQAFPDTADEQEWRDRAGALDVHDPDGQPYRALTEEDL